jgi:deoxyribonuclease-4
MKYIGAHVSAAGGVFNAPLNAKEIGANAFSLFTKNQRQWKSKPLDDDTIAKFKETVIKYGFDFDKIIPHDSYLINIGNPEEEKRAKSLSALLDEARRAEQLGLSLLNFHPGAHLNKISEDECLTFINEGINTVCNETDFITLVIENTAGMGSSVGYKFEHLSKLLENVTNPDRVGICIDTAHLFASGYDFRTPELFNKTFSMFDKLIGFNYLKAMHLNDSKTALGSRVDRHHSLGKGEIGIEPFKLIMNDSRFDSIPLILETIDDSIWADEIELLRSFETG